MSSNDYESSQSINKQIIEFINVLTSEVEQPKQIWKVPKGLKIKCKVNGKRIGKVHDYYKSHACKESRGLIN